MNSSKKLAQALNDLKNAMQRREEALNDHLVYAGIAKCFEVCLEYSWKHLKRILEAEGVEAYSPKEIIRSSAQAGLIEEAETWIECINVRNFAVHDYLGVTPNEYLDTIERFMPLATKLAKR